MDANEMREAIKASRETEAADWEREVQSLRARADAAEAECERLREQVATLEHATCSCCDRTVNRRIDAVICDYCYEERLA